MQNSVALVSRGPRFREAGEMYLRVNDDGSTAWVDDPASATCFGSMREAARMAFRLPADLKAYGIPLRPGLEAPRVLH